jgi:hypothetical protein
MVRPSHATGSRASGISTDTSRGSSVPVMIALPSMARALLAITAAPALMKFLRVNGDNWLLYLRATRSFSLSSVQLRGKFPQMPNGRPRQVTWFGGLINDLRHSKFEGSAYVYSSAVDVRDAIMLEAWQHFLMRKCQRQFGAR